MTGLALALVLAAGLVHATWNYLLKRSGGGIAFMWLFTFISITFYAPIVAGVILVKQPHLGMTALTVILTSAVVHTIYYLLLDRGYRYGDLSLVYPMARATGPFITIIVAVVFLGERPSVLALSGAALIVGGAFFLTGNPAKLVASEALRGVIYALLTGCAIAGYTIVDKLGVAAALVPPVVFNWGVNVGRFAMMSPLALRDRSRLAEVWRLHRKSVIIVGILCPLSYIMVLTAMVFTPVSYVAPAREIAILFGAVMGTQLLREGDVKRRLVSAAAMALGVIGLALG